MYDDHDALLRREKALGDRPLSYSSRGTLMTDIDRSSSAASSQRKLQVGTLCCQVRSLLRVVFVSFKTCGIDAGLS